MLAWIAVALAQSPAPPGALRGVPPPVELSLASLAEGADLVVVGSKGPAGSTAAYVDESGRERGPTFWTDFVVDEVLKGPASVSEGDVIRVLIRGAMMEGQPMLVFLQRADSGMYRPVSRSVVLVSDPWGRLRVANGNGTRGPDGIRSRRAKVDDGGLFEVAEEKTAPLLGPGPQRAHTWQEIVALAGQHPVTPEPTSTFAFAVEASRSLMTR